MKRVAPRAAPPPAASPIARLPPRARDRRAIAQMRVSCVRRGCRLCASPDTAEAGATQRGNEVQPARPYLRATSAETPIERGSVTGVTGDASSAGTDRVRRASPGGLPGAPFPRVRGPLDRADRRSSRSLTGDDQGVFLRPHGGEGAGGQGPLPGRMPRVRRLHPVAGREGGRLRLLQGVPPGRDRAPLDARGGACGDACVASAVRPAPVIVRLVLNPRPRAWRRSDAAAESGRLAVRERRWRCVRYLASSA